MTKAIAEVATKVVTKAVAKAVAIDTTTIAVSRDHTTTITMDPEGTNDNDTNPTIMKTIMDTMRSHINDGTTTTDTATRCNCLRIRPIGHSHITITNETVDQIFDLRG